MNKKISNKTAIPEDSNLKLAWKKYGVGNFHTARVLAKAILGNDESSASSREQAAHILTMSGIDTRALLSGLAVLLFSLIIAFLVAY